MMSKRLTYLLFALLALSIGVSVFAFFGRKPQADYRTVAAEIIKRHGLSEQPIPRIARKQVNIVFSESDGRFLDSSGNPFNGRYTEYYKSLNQRSIIHFEAGLAQGEVHAFARNGRLRERITYNMGVRHGAYARYDRFDHILISGNYVDGQMDGEWKLYFPDGSARYIATYTEGKLKEEWFGEFPAEGMWKKFDREWAEDE